MKNDKSSIKQQRSCSAVKERSSDTSSAFDSDEKTLFSVDDDDFDVETIDIDTALEDFDDILEEEVRHTLNSDLDDDFVEDLENQLLRELQTDFGDAFDDFSDDDFSDDDFSDDDFSDDDFSDSVFSDDNFSQPTLDKKSAFDTQSAFQAKHADHSEYEADTKPTFESKIADRFQNKVDTQNAVSSQNTTNSPKTVGLKFTTGSESITDGFSNGIIPTDASSVTVSTSTEDSTGAATLSDTDISADTPAMPEDAASKPKRSRVPYVVIGVLSVSLVALGTVTLVSLNRLVSLQSRVSQLQQTVVDISDSASTLSQKAEELKNLQGKEAEEEKASVQSGEVQGPQKPAIPEESMEEQGTLSPSKGNTTFTNNTDESMDSLLVQIQPLLPQNNGNWSVYVCNLNKGSEGIIGGGAMQAASLIKLYIMGTVYENYDSLVNLHGKEQIDSNLKAMITVSDNDAANTLVNWLGSGDDANGMEMVNNFCQAHGYTETSMGRLLLHSKENGDNYTSVRDCGRFLKEIYYLNNGIATDSTLSHADSMFALLKQQQRVNKIPADLPEGVQVANKTGELTDVENDAGIIYNTPQGIDLVVCFMSENLTDTLSAQENIAENSRLIYGYYNE